MLKGGDQLTIFGQLQYVHATTNITTTARFTRSTTITITPTAASIATAYKA